MKNILEKLVHKKESMLRGMKILVNSFGSIILSSSLCLCIGIYLGRVIKRDNSIITDITVGVLIITLYIILFIYYKYEYNRIGIEEKEKNKYLKFIFWGMVFTLFCIFMVQTYEKFLESYKHNIFGIDQTQYIIILNFIIFMVLGAVVYQICTSKYNIKNISKDGIELERVIENNNLEFMKTNTQLTENIYNELGELDKVVDFLISRGKLKKGMSEEEYLKIVDLLCSSLLRCNSKINTQIYSEIDYKSYLEIDEALGQRELKLLHARYEKYGIIKLENDLHIKYKYAAFHKFDSSACYIVMKFDEIFDIQIGRLLYAYIQVFEAIYSKYLIIKENE
ncbi:hypothetical protein lbkm_2620 [Lachnospiraceae bacterium KM106-2]|nr:hypothetical protein lbkm_2620 [Lachnospiraceae bacterium KM106-2]